jgi:precorrin-2 dehydrogenase/sirohydrochlorin ferrochelatase
VRRVSSWRAASDSDPDEQNALCYVGHSIRHGLALEINKIYRLHQPDLIAESLGFSHPKPWSSRSRADSLIRTITSLHWPATTFLGNLEKPHARRSVSKPPSRLSEEKIPLFPMFVKLAKRRCLVVGAGKTAEEKIPTLLRCGANVVVVASVATRDIKAWATEKKIVWEQRPFVARDLDGVFLAVVATPLKTLNRTVFEQARQRGILCNVVRDRTACDFYYPAVVRRGPLQIAISTAGHSGALAQRLRKQLESQFGPEWESWLRWLGEARSSLYDDALSSKRRRTMLHRMASSKKQAEFFHRWGYPSNREST